MSREDRLNPGEQFRWYPSTSDHRPVIQDREVDWLLQLHAKPFHGRDDVPPCQCSTCMTGRRWWRNHYGEEWTLGCRGLVGAGK